VPAAAMLMSAVAHVAYVRGRVHLKLGHLGRVAGQIEGDVRVVEPLARQLAPVLMAQDPALAQRSRQQLRPAAPPKRPRRRGRRTQRRRRSDEIQRRPRHEKGMPACSAPSAAGESVPPESLRTRLERLSPGRRGGSSSRASPAAIVRHAALLRRPSGRSATGLRARCRTDAGVHSGPTRRSLGTTNRSAGRDCSSPTKPAVSRGRLDPRPLLPRTIRSSAARGPQLRNRAIAMRQFR
jgi:hypothetical protein